MAKFWLSEIVRRPKSVRRAVQFVSIRMFACDLIRLGGREGGGRRDVRLSRRRGLVLGCGGVDSGDRERIETSRIIGWCLYIIGRRSLLERVYRPRGGSRGNLGCSRLASMVRLGLDGGRRCRVLRLGRGGYVDDLDLSRIELRVLLPITKSVGFFPGRGERDRLYGFSSGSLR